MENRTRKAPLPPNVLVNVLGNRESQKYPDPFQALRRQNYTEMLGLEM